MISLIRKAIIDNIAQMVPLRRYLQKAINSYRTMIALSVIVVVLGLIYIIATDEPSESLFGAGNLEGKGKLVSLYLTAIGGCAVFYGLWLNSRRIGEQTRQNNIADRTNNDKRFGDAIGYLNSENIGIAIGGAYALHQLAKEDERYVPIVANIFCEALNREQIKDNIDAFEKLSNTISDLLLNTGYNLFSSIKLIIYGASFGYLKFNEKIKHVVFKNCNFKAICFDNAEDITFRKCEMKDMAFNECQQIWFYENRMYEIQMMSKSM